jgi:AAA15 family ATPase/GTPase
MNFIFRGKKMLIEFSVQNFGSIKSKQTLSFEATKDDHLEDYYIIPTKIKGLKLLKLGLIYGANASGKTTVLQALDFLRDIVLNPKREKDVSFKFEPYLFDKKTPYENTVFNISFIQNNIRYDYEVELNKKAIVKEKLDFYNPNKANIFTRTTDVEKQYTNKIAFGHKMKKNKSAEDILKANTLWNNTVIGGFVKTNIENNELKDVRDWFSLHLSHLIHTRSDLFVYVTKKLKEEDKLFNKNRITDMLKAADFGISNLIIKTKAKKMPPDMIKYFGGKQVEEIIDENKSAKDNVIISVNTNEGIISQTRIAFEHVVNKESYELSFDKESQGTQRYYELAGILLMLTKNSVITSIDELERSLHPDLFKHFLLSFLINSKNSQIIASTHSREILNDKDIFRNDAIWITEKNKESATRLYSLSDFDSSVIRDTTSIYNAYKNGKLGGVPNLSNYYVGTEQ